MMFMTIWDDILLAVTKALRSLFMSLCDVVYRLIVIFYDIFEQIGTATLLSNDTVMGMYRKVGLILGLFMVFRVSFSIINYIINPDLMSDKQKGMGNIIRRIIIVVVLLGITPSLFREAYALQNMLIKENIVGKILFEDNSSISSDNGKNLAWFGFNSFYYLNKEEWRAGISLEDKGNTEEGNPIIKEGDPINVDSLYKLCPEMDDRDGVMNLVEFTFREGGTFKYAYNCLNETLKVRRGNIDEQLWVINFDGHGLICTIVGILLLWTILMYTVQLGVRLLQLAYLQLIAPIPIIMYLDPKSEALTKWTKQCTTTFLDFFIRTGIMYFAIFIINLLVNNDNNFLDSFNGLSKLYVKVVMIIAILIFAKRVPKLLEEIIPMLKNAASLDFGLSLKKNVIEPAATSPIGAPIGHMAKKGIGFVDRKVHHLPKQRNSFQQYMDKLMPGRAEVIKNRNEIKDRRQLEDIGNKIYKKRGGDELSAKAFSSREFRNSWAAVKAAKSNVKSAENALEMASNIYRLTPDDITAKENYEKAKKALAIANSILEDRKKDHNNMRAIHTKDARREDAYNYAKNLRGSTTSNSQNPSSNQQNSSSNSQNRTQNLSNPSLSSQNPSLNTQNPSLDPQNPSLNQQNPSLNSAQQSDYYNSQIEDAYNKLYEMTGNGASQDEINDQVARIKDLDNERNSVENNIADFYDNRSDSQSSQGQSDDSDNW